MFSNALSHVSCNIVSWDFDKPRIGVLQANALRAINMLRSFCLCILTRRDTQPNSLAFHSHTDFPWTERQRLVHEPKHVGSHGKASACIQEVPNAVILSQIGPQQPTSKHFLIRCSLNHPRRKGEWRYSSIILHLGTRCR
jgi:hypothetical protein